MIKSNNTVQKRVLLEELSRIKDHPTAEILYERIRMRLPKVSLATVYRILEQLSQKGDLLCLEGAGRQRRYDGTVMEHYHVRCPKCGQLEDFPIKVAQPLKEKLLEVVRERELKGVYLEFIGTCKNCKSPRSQITS